MARLNKLKSNTRKATPVRSAAAERIQEVAIMRNGEILRRGCRSHYELRRALNPNDDAKITKPGDIDGFFTSAGHFLDRRQAIAVALAAGQVPYWEDEAPRELLSSEINW